MLPQSDALRRHSPDAHLNLLRLSAGRDLFDWSRSVKALVNGSIFASLCLKEPHALGRINEMNRCITSPFVYFMYSNCAILLEDYDERHDHLDR